MFARSEVRKLAAQRSWQQNANFKTTAGDLEDSRWPRCAEPRRRPGSRRAPAGRTLSPLWPVGARRQGARQQLGRLERLRLLAQVEIGLQPPPPVLLLAEPGGAGEILIILRHALQTWVGGRFGQFRSCHHLRFALDLAALGVRDGQREAPSARSTVCGGKDGSGSADTSISGSPSTLGVSFTS